MRKILLIGCFCAGLCLTAAQGFALGSGEDKTIEDMPEMANLENIDIAFLPMNQPYTMTPAQVANAVKMVKPKIVYPYHYGDTNVKELETLLDSMDVDLRVRDLQ
ncbi:MAG: MBL fold metallo-hydrolase [Spirochaetales bacterium]|nr:MBL fold metallo-hydrolase [Spirochaetales bacterium]